MARCEWLLVGSGCHDVEYPRVGSKKCFQQTNCFIPYEVVG